MQSSPSHTLKKLDQVSNDIFFSLLFLKERKFNKKKFWIVLSSCYYESPFDKQNMHVIPIKHFFVNHKQIFLKVEQFGPTLNFVAIGLYWSPATTRLHYSIPKCLLIFTTLQICLSSLLKLLIIINSDHWKRQLKLQWDIFDNM